MARTEDRTVLAARLIKAREARSVLLAGREIQEVDDCPAVRHRHSVRGWREDHCRCPSTRKAWERKQETERDASRAYRRSGTPSRLDPRSMAQFDLRKADRFDAEAIVQGYRIARTSVHTRGLAVRLLRSRTPEMTDRQVAEWLTAAGQGRLVSYAGTAPRYQPVSVRQVQRIQAALDFRQLKHPHRAGSRLDRSGRTR